MLLKYLKLINFRNHRMSMIDFKKKINFIYGPNGAGKTSILDGICYLLLGRNIRTSKAGAGANDLITFGEGRCQIEGEVEGVGKITRSIPYTLAVNQMTEGIREQQKFIEDQLGVTGDKIDLCINSTLFTQLSSRQKKEMLFDLLGEGITKDLVKKEFIAWARENSVREPEKLFDYYMEKKEIESQLSNPEEVLDHVLLAGQKGQTITRYKGLGEMNPDQLWETTMNPETRTLMQVRVDDAVSADEVFTMLMGDAVEPRREFIEQNALEVTNLDI